MVEKTNDYVSDVKSFSLEQKTMDFQSEFSGLHLNLQYQKLKMFNEIIIWDCLIYEDQLCWWFDMQCIEYLRLTFLWPSYFIL